MRRPPRWMPVVLAVTLGVLFAGPVFGQTSYTLSETAPRRLPDGVPVTLHGAESIRWHPERRLLTARGNVRVTWGPYRIRADRLRFFEQERRLVAEGNLRARSPKFDRFRADRVELIRPSGRIRLRNLEGRMPVEDGAGSPQPWYVDGARVDGQPDTLLVARGSSFTTCNLKTPHYDFRASTVYVYPDNVIVGYNTTFNVGPVPIFYFPVVAVDLADRLKRWEIRPGYSDREGLELELNYHYLLEEDPGPITSTIYTDFRENAGAGGGFDLGYEDELGDAYFFLFGARRNPTLLDATGDVVRSDTEQTILRLRSSTNYRFGEEAPWRTQVHANWIENNRFDRDFRSSVGGRAQPTRSMDATLVREGQNSIFRIDGRREDRFDETVGANGDFVTRREVLPRVRYQLFSVPVDLFGQRLFYSSNNLAEKRLPGRGSERTLWNVALENDLTKIVSLSPAFSQSYTVGYDQDWVERSTATGERVDPIGSGRFRWRNFLSVTDALDLELDYRHEQRLNQRDTTPFELNGRDLSPAENGEVAHRIGVIGRWETARTFAFLRTGYDLRDSLRVDVESDSRVIDPALNLGVQLTPYWRWSQWLRYGWTERAVQQLNTTWTFQPSRDLRLAFDWNFTRTSGPGNNLSEFGSRFFWRSPADRWRLRGDLIWDSKRETFEETRLTVYRSLHKWEVRAFYRRIEDRDNEFWLLFNLKGYPSTALGLASELPGFSPEFEQQGLEELY